MSVLIIGIGNKYRSDDAVGLHIADSIRTKVNRYCTVVTTSGEGIALLNLWEGYNTVILIDAVKSDAPPGELYMKDLTHEDLNVNWFQASSHLFSIPEAVELARQLEKQPEQLYFFGIEGKSFAYGDTLSQEVEEASQVLIAHLLDTIEQMEKNPQKSPIKPISKV